MVRRSLGWTFLALALGLGGNVAVLADEPANLEAQAAIAASDAKARCAAVLVKAGEVCAVAESGRVGTIAGHKFAYARYDLTPPPDSPLYPLHYGRVVIFEALAGAKFLPILISGDDAAFFYGTPKIVHAGGRVLLHVPASEDGTGNFNRELLYVWAKDGWRDADVTSWLDDLGGYLPKGLGVQKGIYPDYATMKAETPLWHDDDGGNCPNGGTDASICNGKAIASPSAASA